MTSSPKAFIFRNQIQLTIGKELAIMFNSTQVYSTNKSSTSYISTTFMIYKQTICLILYLATHMEIILLLAGSSTLAKTKIFLILILDIL